MECPHCFKETSERYFKDGAGTCEHCHRIIQYECEFKPQINLPGIGRLISTFAKEISEEIKNKNELFYRIDSKEIVELGKIKHQENEEETYTGFTTVKPNQFITIVERYVEPGMMTKNKRTEEWEFKQHSISSELANTLLASDILKKSLPQINRIFTIPIPILYKEELTFPTKGYDPRFTSWLPEDAPGISKPEMTLEQAKEIFKEVFGEFCFQSQQDYYNALAALLTPYLRGLYPNFTTRTPVFFYLANRERAGKDYLAGITGIVYEGIDLQEAPICSAEKNGNNSEELRKKFLSNAINGRKRMHFSNNKGYIDNAVFESITTLEHYSDRLLGRNETVTIGNEMDFSLSGNVGVGFTPDFSNRCRFIHLFLDIENANAREFNKPNLHKFVLENRSKVISAMYCLVRNWKEKGMPKGTLNFASYPSWASICGGIMEAAGYGNPCIIEKTVVSVAGDAETTDMKALFETMFEQTKEEVVDKKDIIEIAGENGLFAYWDLETNKSDQTKFGTLLIKYIGRMLSDIYLIDITPSQRPSRKKFKFTKSKPEVSLINF
jgi:hypothetical protein